MAKGRVVGLNNPKLNAAMLLAKSQEIQILLKQLDESSETQPMLVTDEIIILEGLKKQIDIFNRELKGALSSDKHKSSNRGCVEFNDRNRLHVGEFKNMDGSGTHVSLEVNDCVSDVEDDNCEECKAIFEETSANQKIEECCPMFTLPPGKNNCNN